MLTVRPWWASLATRCHAHGAYAAELARHTGTRPLLAWLRGGLASALSLLIWSGSTAVYSNPRGGRVTFELSSYPGPGAFARGAAALVLGAVILVVVGQSVAGWVAACALVVAVSGAVRLLVRPTPGAGLTLTAGAAIATWMLIQGGLAGALGVLPVLAGAVQLGQWWDLRRRFAHFEVRPHRYVTTVVRWRDGPGESQPGDFGLAWKAFGAIAGDAAWTVGLDADNPDLRDKVYAPLGLTPEPGGEPLRLAQRFGDPEQAPSDET